jgi:hypothetical protein
MRCLSGRPSSSAAGTAPHYSTNTVSLPNALTLSLVPRSVHTAAWRCGALHFVLSLRLVAYGLHEAITGELRARGHTVDGDVRSAPLRSAGLDSAAALCRARCVWPNRNPPSLRRSTKARA